MFGYKESLFKIDICSLQLHLPCTTWTLLYIEAGVNVDRLVITVFKAQSKVLLDIHKKINYKNALSWF